MKFKLLKFVVEFVLLEFDVLLGFPVGVVGLELSELLGKFIYFVRDLVLILIFYCYEPHNVLCLLSKP
jgi:hypothetical protein